MPAAATRIVPVPRGKLPGPAFDDAGLLVEDGIGNGGPDGLEGLRSGARDQQGMAVPHDPFGDGGHLEWRLALSEDDFRKPFPGGPLVIHAGKPQVLERLGAEPIQQLGLDGFDRHLAAPQPPEQVVESVGIHRRAPEV